MSDDVSDACHVFWGGTCGVLDDLGGCPGCVYLLGAAAAFGLIGMAQAIRDNGPWACPDCLKYKGGTVTGMPAGYGSPDEILAPRETICIECYDKRKARLDRRAHPYR